MKLMVLIKNIQLKIYLLFKDLSKTLYSKLRVCLVASIMGEYILYQLRKNIGIHLVIGIELLNGLQQPQALTCLIGHIST